MGGIMVIRPKSKSLTTKKTTKPKTVVKKPVAKNSSTMNKDLQTIIDLHTKQLQKLDMMYSEIQGELRDLKKLIPGLPIDKDVKKSIPLVAKKAPVKPVVKKPVKTAVKSVPVKPSLKTQAKTATKPTKLAKPVTAVKNQVKSNVSSSFSDSLVLIPKDIPNRINNLTLKKKVTQTQLGKEVDLSQKVIHEIATRKMKDINKDTLSKIVTVLKKYETK